MPDNEKIELPKIRKVIFTIMPFTQSPTRNKEELNLFFEHEIKKSIEANLSFRHSYEVRRSGIDFDITGQIIRDLHDAYLVICDLSGERANPNVMFELGIRLTCSNKPVILIREDHTDNKPIFDIQGLHTFAYNPRAYPGLREHLEEKIKRFELGQENYRSPVLAILAEETRIHRIDRVRAANLVAVLQVGLTSHLNVLVRLLSSYLADKVEFQLDPNPFLLGQQIDQTLEALEEVDWSGIRLAIGPHPALSYYLSTRYLDGLLEEGLERDFSFRVLQFFETYFINLMGVIDFDLRRIRDFAHNAALLSAACHFARIILNSEEESPQHLESVMSLRTLLDKQIAPLAH